MLIVYQTKREGRGGEGTRGGGRGGGREGEGRGKREGREGKGWADRGSNQTKKVRKDGLVFQSR